MCHDAFIINRRGSDVVLRLGLPISRCDPCRISLCRVHRGRTPKRRQMLAYIKVGDLLSKPSKAIRVIMDINLNLVEHSVVCKNFPDLFLHSIHSFSMAFEKRLLKFASKRPNLTRRRTSDRLPQEDLRLPLILLTHPLRVATTFACTFDIQ